ncbi:MAG TPA: TlpA disulfide reductase family protein [Alphaproteobacteria bacterium]|nr:TlpA disulfide reductase family protein [Alphaproteobacteria bacterium]HNS43721.1 TlpA disulfide reductase family protein [Alphaproteobacteria bacterium]
MKQLNLIVLALAIVAGFLLTIWLDDSGPPAQQAAQQSTQDNRAPLPVFDITALDGNTYKISDFKGKIVLLNFWASWCAPCVVEFPKLVELAASRDDLILIALSNDIDKDKIENFLAKQPDAIKEKLKSSNIIISRDEGKKITEDLFQTYKLPETILIDRKGRMAEKIVGDTDWTGEELKAKLSKL